jgi:hypothetical protein
LRIYQPTTRNCEVLAAHSGSHEQMHRREPPSKASTQETRQLRLQSVEVASFLRSTQIEQGLDRRPLAMVFQGCAAEVQPQVPDGLPPQGSRAQLQELAAPAHCQTSMNKPSQKSAGSHPDKLGSTFWGVKKSNRLTISTLIGLSDGQLLKAG